MKKKNLIPVIVSFLILAVNLSAQNVVSPQNTGKIRIGIAKSPISGCAKKSDWTIHDELYGGALWIDDGKSPVVLITLDYVEMTSMETAQTKKEITRILAIPSDRILICCSHTHSGMDADFTKLGIVLSGIIRQAREKAQSSQVAFKQYNAGKGLSVNRRLKVNDQFGTFTITYSRGTQVSLEKGIVDARGQVEDFIRYGVNIYTPNYASKGIKPGKIPSNLAPAVLKEIPERLLLNGPVDPNLEVLSFSKEDGTSIGTLVRYSCHPVIFNGSLSKQYSADFPGVLTREISKITGTPSLFINGPCGNIKPVFTDYGEAETERFGRALAEKITGSFSHLKAEPLNSFSYIHREEEFEIAPDMRNHTPANFAEYDSLSNGNFDPLMLKKKLDALMRSWAINYYGLKEEKMSLPFSLLGFNRIALVTLPGEIFTEHGLAIQNRLPGKPIMIGELTDTDAAGYVPTRESFRDGGYEVSCATIIPGSGEKMVRIASQMLKEFYQEK